MTPAKSRRIAQIEAEALHRFLRSQALTDVARRMRAGLTERQAKDEMLTEMGCKEVIPLLREYRRKR